MKLFQKIDTKVLLSTLWIFVMFNYLYCDLMTMMDPEELNKFITGTVDGIKITELFLFIAAIVMEIPIVMILLSRILRYKINRLANIVAGIIKTVIMLGTMFMAMPTSYYIFFGSIEIACTSFITWTAYRWKEDD